LKLDTTKIIYVLIFVLVAYPLIFDITIPLPVSDYTANYGKAVNSITPGTVVGFNNLASGASYQQLGSAIIRTMVTVWEKGGVIMFFETRTEGVPFTQLMIDAAKKIYAARNPGKTIEYDVNYVQLGYIAGEETGFAAFIADIKGIIKEDIHGTPTDQLNLIKDVTDGSDVPFMVHIMAGVPSPYMLRQYQTKYGGTMVEVCTDVDLAGEMPYIQSGQVAGVIIGASGAAQYEAVTGIPGPNLRLVNPLSLTSVLVIVVLVLGNADYLYNKYKGGNN
jgi:hypothetical protein